MEEVTYAGRSIIHTFLYGTGRLSPRERSLLLDQATIMFVTSRKRASISSDTYEGEIITEGKFQSLGQFYGQRYDAIVENNHGKAKLAFLVSEQTGGQGLASRLN